MHFDIGISIFVCLFCVNNLLVMKYNLEQFRLGIRFIIIVSIIFKNLKKISISLPSLTNINHAIILTQETLHTYFISKKSAFRDRFYRKHPLFTVLRVAEVCIFSSKYRLFEKSVKISITLHKKPYVLPVFSKKISALHCT